MEDLIIQGGNTSPYVEFRTNGKLKIQGRILTDNAVHTFEPLVQWISKFKVSKIEFIIDLDYINTSASMQLFSLIRILDLNTEIDEVLVKWYYEQDDEDHLETGEFYEDKLTRVEFDYIAVKDRMVA
jgi:hypothetical protein